MIQRKMGLLWGFGAAAAVLFCAPSFLVGFTTIGGSLSTSSGGYQRDVRVFNNFIDATANDNSIPDDLYPGTTGAELAIWKAAAVWGSGGGGGRAFDFDWQGNATSIGSRDNNTVSSLQSGCGGSTLAFMEGPISNGWRIRFCENRSWDDGPGAVSGFDLQGVGVHELGHALGLGHSDGGCVGSCMNRPAMCASVCGDGTAERAIKPDDRAGLQFIYGTIPGNKPKITGISGSMATGGTLVLTGMNFANSVNVKFTARTSQNSGGIPGVVFGVPSTNGGTRVQVTVPNAAESGNVLVWQPGNGGLSNGFPIYINEDPPTISNVFPIEGPARGGTEITVMGSNFRLNAGVEIGGTPIPVTFRSETELRFPAPPGEFIGEMVDVSVVQGTGTATVPNAFLYTDNPVRLEWVGSTQVGRPLTLTVYGPANKDVALAIGSPGLTERLGISFCAEAPFPFVRKFSAGINTGPAGRVDTVWPAIEGEIFQSWNIIGVLRQGPGVIEDLGCGTLTVFP